MLYRTLVAGSGFLALALSITAPLGCNKDRRGKVDEAQVVARIDGDALTLADFDQRMKELPAFVRRRYATPERRKELLDNLVRFELLAREARKRGYERDPDVVRQAKQRMIEKMLAEEVDAKFSPYDLKDEELRKFYDENPKLFTQPEAVRVSQIVVADKALATKLSAQAKALDQTDSAGFEKLVATHSVDRDSRERGGDVGFLDRGSTEVPLHLIEAAFALKELGHVSPPVQTEKGFHVLRLTQRKVGFVRPFADVKGETRNQLYQQRRVARTEELVAEMRKSVKVEVFEDKLEHLIKTPPRPPGDGGAADGKR